MAEFSVPKLNHIFIVMQEDVQRTTLELDSYKEKTKENQEKIKLNKQLPYLVGNIVEVQLFAILLDTKITNRDYCISQNFVQYLLVVFLFMQI